MRDLVYLGSAPPDEPCAQVGSYGYREAVLDQCKRYIALIRKTVGIELFGAKLKVEWQEHDFGSYAEVVCWYDDAIDGAREYAYRCESDGPLTWDPLGIEEFERSG